jgi:hypothetical protein
MFRLNAAERPPAFTNCAHTAILRNTGHAFV